MLFYVASILDVSKMYSKDFRRVKPPAMLAMVLAALAEQLVSFSLQI